MSGKVTKAVCITSTPDPSLENLQVEYLTDLFDL
jgi:hypothetical protein